MENIYNEAAMAIKEYDMITPGELVIVGVSGGPDSIALLHILLRLQKEMGFNIHAAHLDHSFRGTQAEEEANWVREVAESWGIPCTIVKADVAALAKEKKTSAQDAGHMARKKFFLSLKNDLGAQKIALGHQADDQAETLLMHFLTGAGSEGLSGILPKQGAYIRPLLFVKRVEIEKYCQEYRLFPRRDPSNDKNIYLRNKIRNQLMPWLIENINPNLIDTLNRTSKIFLSQEEYLQSKINEAAQKCIINEKGKIKILLENFSAYHLAIQRRLVRTAYQMIGEKQGILYKHVEEVRELLLKKQVGKVLHLPGDIKIEKEYDAAIFYRGGIPENADNIEKQVLLIPGSTGILKTEQVVMTDFSYQIPDKIPENTAYLPWEEFTGPLYVRSRIEGDKFTPSGYNKSRKLKEYFIDKKIPRKERDGILLLVDQKGVLWIMGIASGNRINKKSVLDKYVVIRIEKCLLE